MLIPWRVSFFGTKIRQRSEDVNSPSAPVRRNLMSAGFVDLWSNSQKQKNPEFHQKTHEIKHKKSTRIFSVETLESQFSSGNLETNIHSSETSPSMIFSQRDTVGWCSSHRKIGRRGCSDSPAVWPGSEPREAIESIALVCRKALEFSLRAG